MARNNNKTKNNCQKYEQAITNFVVGQKMDITKEELFEHLKNCKECRKDLTQWQDTMTVLKMDAFSKSPEGKAKMKQDFEKLKAKLARVPSAQQSISPTRTMPIDVKWSAGSAAGKVYNLLKANGKMPIPVLVQKTGLKEYHIQQAIGWLACQEKIALSRDDKTVYASLNPGV